MAVERQRLRGSVHDLEGPPKLLVRHGDAVDTDALGGFDQVRRGEQTGMDPRGAQTRLDHGASGTFAVGAGHMHGAERALRVAERVEHRADPVQSQLGGLDFVTERVEKAYRVGIGNHSFPRRYTSHADAMTAAVPNASFPSNSQTFFVSAVGTTEHTIASIVIAHPDKALIRFPAFHAPPKM